MKCHTIWNWIPPPANIWTEDLFVLRFYGPVNPMGSCRARSVYLTTRLLGRLSHLTVYQYCAHSFARNWQLPFLNQWKGENDHRKYFMINPHERMLPTSSGLNPRSPGLQSDGASNWATEAGLDRRPCDPNSGAQNTLPPRHFPCKFKSLHFPICVKLNHV